ncbi:hypothetical protein C1645_778757 [Glomus cerebriforme]|uniref:AIG1-type G domain-containing protein n=1 Tax=Glomus cerebriforme TaxID=658196 RepID=A0A397SKS5_9GLOM|nr:hypothetical protein C1645_778757 [Glomus cerebriforme]
MAEIRNILLIGNVGNGKSTLANVLTGTNEFEESTNRIHGNSEAKSKEFEHKRIKYRIIDTVGIGDSERTTEEILSKIRDKAEFINEGLNQILFVTNGRFNDLEVKAFGLLNKFIFDNQVADYTTIVCTNFPDFENEEACKEDLQTFRGKIANLSMPLASTATIYVDNPPIKGRYKSISEDSRKASRKVLLERLETCQEVYQPELLAKFIKMIDEFNLIIKDTNKAISNIYNHLDNNIKYLGEFITERENIVEMIENFKEKIKEYMKERYTTSTLSHAALLSGKALTISGIFFPPTLVPGVIISASGLLGVAGSESVAIAKENATYKLFEERLVKDKEKCETLEKSQAELKEYIEELKTIRPRFENSEYKKENIDSKKIEVISNVFNNFLGEEINIDVNLKNEKTEHSTGKKAGLAVLETICLVPPSLISIYFIYRANQEVKSRTSLDDMEKIIKNWGEEFKELEEKKGLLKNEYDKIMLCKEEMAKLLPESER